MNQLIDYQELEGLLLPLQGAACFMDIDYEVTLKVMNYHQDIQARIHTFYCNCSTVCECAENKRDKKQQKGASSHPHKHWSGI